MVKKCIVAGCVIIDSNRVILLKHKKLGFWIYPGGHVDQNETPIEAALRETREETGLDAEIVDLSKTRDRVSSSDVVEMPQPLAILYETVPYASGIHMHFDLIYLAKRKKGTRAVKNEESDAMGWFGEKELDALETTDDIRKTIKRAFAAVRKLNR